MSTRSVGPEFDQHARTASDGVGAQRKTASRKNVLMCKPEFFTVSYRINPWMNPLAPTDTSRAVRQWQNLYDIYADLGFDVQLIDPVRGLPDMVYAANGGFVIDNVAYGARFAHVERQPEGPAFMEWFSTSIPRWPFSTAVQMNREIRVPLRMCRARSTSGRARY